MRDRGICVTSIAGFDSNANGRAKRGVRWIQEKIRSYLVPDIRSETFQQKAKVLWTFAAQHAGEVHRRETLGEPACQSEFGQRILFRIKEPKNQV